MTVSNSQRVILYYESVIGFCDVYFYNGDIAQSVRAFASHARGPGFESLYLHQMQKSAIFGLKIPDIADFYFVFYMVLLYFISFCYQKTLPFFT